MGPAEAAGRLGRGHRHPARNPPSRERARRDHADLAHDPGHNEDDGGRQEPEGPPRPIRAELEAHRPDRLSNDGDRGELEPVEPARAPDPRQRLHPVGKRDHRRGGRKHEAGGGEQRTGKARAPHADREDDLAARGPRQELAERNHVGVGGVVQPAPPLDKLPAEVPKVRDRATERGQTEPQERGADIGKPFEVRQGSTSPGTPSAVSSSASASPCSCP